MTDMFTWPVFPPGRAPREALNLTARQAVSGAMAWRASLSSTGENAILAASGESPVVRLEQTSKGVFVQLAEMMAVVDGNLLDLRATPETARRLMMPGFGSQQGLLPLRLVTEATILEPGQESAPFQAEALIWHLEVGPGTGLPVAMIRRGGQVVIIDEDFLPPAAWLGSVPDRADRIRSHLQPLLDVSVEAEEGVLSGLLPDTYLMQRLALFQDRVDEVLCRASATQAETYQSLGTSLSALARILRHEARAVLPATQGALHKLEDVLPLAGLEKAAGHHVDAHRSLSEGIVAPAEIHGPDPAGRSEIVAMFPASVADMIGKTAGGLRIEVRGLRALQGATTAVHPWHRPERLHSTLSHAPLEHLEDGFSVWIETDQGDGAPAREARREILASKRVRLVLPLAAGLANSATPTILLSRSLT